MKNNFISVVDALPGLVWTALPDGQVDFVNHQWRQYTGISLNDSCGRGWQTAIHPEDLPQLVEQLKSSILSGEPCEAELRIRRFDGEFRWFSFRSNVITDAAGAITGCCCLSWDIADSKEFVEPLRKAQGVW